MMRRYCGSSTTGQKRYLRAGSEEEARAELSIELPGSLSSLVELPASERSIRIETLLKLNAPDWFARGDFMAWLRGRLRRQQGCAPATWHQPSLETPGEYSDVFVTIDLGDPPMHTADGSDSDALPSDVWDEIAELFERTGAQHGVVWLTNLPE